MFLRKLLRIGGLPAELRANVDAVGDLFMAEYVPVTRRFSVSVPGKRANANISNYVGSLVLTSQGGPVKADISSSGLHIEVDIGEVDPKFKGHLSLNYKTPIPDDVLAQLPARSLAFEVPPEYVLRAVGVPAHG